jgi:hypothetical protein
VYNRLVTLLMGSFYLWIDRVVFILDVERYFDLSFDFLREWEVDRSNRTGDVVSSLLLLSWMADFFVFEGR